MTRIEISHEEAYFQKKPPNAKKAVVAGGTLSDQERTCKATLTGTNLVFIMGKKAQAGGAASLHIKIYDTAMSE